MADPQGVTEVTGLVASFAAGFTAILALLGAAVSYGKMKEKNDEQEEKLRAQALEMKEMREEFDRQIKHILDLFTNADNEPRFMTYKAHDKIQGACQKFIHSELTHVKEACDRIERNQEGKVVA